MKAKAHVPKSQKSVPAARPELDASIKSSLN